MSLQQAAEALGYMLILCGLVWVLLGAVVILSLVPGFVRMIETGLIRLREWRRCRSRRLR